MELEISLFALFFLTIIFYIILYLIVRLAVEKGMNRSSKIKELKLQINGLRMQLEKLQEKYDEVSEIDKNRKE